jgi:putative oxidoreductase
MAGGAGPPPAPLTTQGDHAMQSTMTRTLPFTRARGPRARVLDALGRFPLAIIQLAFRLAIASVFLKAGLTKLQSWQLTVQLFADEYRVPVLPPDAAAIMAITIEIGCSLLLVAGIATRLATLPLLGMIAVIQTVVYPGAYAEHLTWSSILLFLLTRGGGALSLDCLVGLERA